MPHPIIELRQYTLHPGQRDTLIDLFEREFIESQEAVGMRLIGQFRDLDNPDRFVWMREFASMEARAQALGDFYSGPVWKAHRDAANATMIDSDNVLLLRPAAPDTGFAQSDQPRPMPGSTAESQALIIATLYYVAAPPSAELLDFFASMVSPALAKSGASIVATLVTETSQNNFPALPVREGEYVLAYFAHFRDQAAYELQLASLAQSSLWQHEIAPELAQQIIRESEIIRLAPTPRSLLR